MSARKSIKRNYIYNMLFHFFTLITPLITIPYTSRVLKAEGVGTASFIGSVANYFFLFAALSIFSYGKREISYYQDNRAKRSRIFWNLKLLAAITVSFSMTVYLLLVYINVKENYHLYVIAGAGMINILLDATWMYVGMEDFGKVILRHMLVRLSFIIFLLTFIKSEADLPYYMCGAILFGSIGHIALWIPLPKFIDKPCLREINPFHDIKTILQLFIPNIAIEVYTVLDKTMIGLFTGDPAENGYYEFSVKTVRLVVSVITSLCVVMSPRIGHLFAHNDMEQIKDYMYRSYNFAWFLGIPICLGLIGISDNFVPWFFGAGYGKVAVLIKIIAFLIMAISFGNLTGAQYLVPTLRHNKFTKSVMIGAAVNFCMNIALIPAFKSYGAAVASVIAECSVSASQLYIVRHELNIRKIFALGKNNYIAGIIMLVFLLLLGKKLAPSLIHTFMMILSGALVYFSVLLVLRDKFFIENARITLASFRKKLHI